MKRIIVLFVVAAMTCVLLFCSGCSGSKVTITIGKATIELEEGFKEVKLSQSEFSEVTHVYEKDGAAYRVKTRTYENPEGLSAEEMARAMGAEQNGCVEDKSNNSSGLSSWLTTFMYDGSDDSHTLVKEYFIEDGKNISSISYCYFTEKIQLGDTGFYMWVPTCYDKAVSEDNDTLNAEVLKFHVDVSPALADFMVIETWKGAYSYDAMVKCCSAMGISPACDEATFNAINKGDRNIDSLFASAEAICGEAAAERVSKTANDNLQEEGLVIEGVYDKTDYTFVLLGLRADDGSELIMVVYGPTATWPGIGDAFAHSVHYEKQ